MRKNADVVRELSDVLFCSGNGPNGRLNALGRQAVLLRWPALLARVGVPARIEEPPPLSPHTVGEREVQARDRRFIPRNPRIC